MSKLTELFIKLRILDPDETISLTNIVLMAATYKFVMTPQLNTETLVALLGALTALQAKKVINQRSAANESSEQLATLGTKVIALESSMHGDEGVKARLTRVESRTAPTMHPPRR
jgi:hypothetical protein